MSIRPQWVENILNLIKLWVIRKKFPKDYVGWVYVYCTKDGYLHLENNGKWSYSRNQKYTYVRTGKVVCRFWCDKVEEIDDCFTMEHINNEYPDTYELGVMEEEQLLKECCLTKEEMNAYYKGAKEPLKAIHINDLEIFDKPKEISEFHKVGYFKRVNEINIVGNPSFAIDYENAVKQYAITRAPQSWFYIEI